MKKLIKMISLSLISLPVSQVVLATSYNHCHPFYLGAEIGYGDTHYSDVVIFDQKHALGDKGRAKDGGLAGRLLAGFDINQNLALELGYTRYSNPEYHFDNDSKYSFSEQSLDFLAKVSLPVTCQLSVYAKGGLSYVHTDDAERVVNNNTVYKLSESNTQVRPMLGVGASYAFTPKVAGTVGYYRTFGKENLGDGDADFVGAGITFRIG